MTAFPAFTSHRRRVGKLLGVLGCIAVVLAGCSLDRLATRTVTDLVSATGDDDVFASERDPLLVGDALPFALKLYEILLTRAHDDPGLHLATGRSFVAYANAFVQRPAEQMAVTEIDRRISELQRAKLHYLRGRDYLLTGLDLRHPGFGALFASPETMNQALQMADASSIDFIYWTAAACLGALSTDPFDMELLISAPYAAEMLHMVIEWDDRYQGGAAHDILIRYYASAASALGGGMERVTEHFERAIAASDDKRAAPYLAMAGVAITEQDPERFRSLLNEALAVELDVAQYRLQNTLDQQYATWLLEHMEDLFVEL
jgi:predicted anti-sigma-YlaC factor YlaD